MDAAELVFPLVPRARLQGMPFGGHASWRRGAGSDVAGSRPYRPGDDVRLVDWPSSARLSAARGSDEFVVREHYADEAPRVVTVADRRPAMGAADPGGAFLDKAAAARAALRAIAESTAAARGVLGYLDLGERGEPTWVAPRSQADAWLVEARLEEEAYAAPEDGVEQALEWLVRQRASLPAGTFVFVVSDFLAGPPPEAWLTAVEHGWDLVPVVVQDPVWEQSFPELHGLVLPVRDPRDGSRLPVALTRREARERRERNEQRLAGLLDEVQGLGLAPVVVGSAEPRAVHAAFLGWAQERLLAGGRP